MTNDPSLQPCAHDGCTCRVPAGQTYCGPHCANAAAEKTLGTETRHCECGHPECGGTTSMAMTF